MNSALVTGASRGIGKEIAKELLRIGFRVYGIGRDFSNTDIDDENFIALKIDLLDKDLYEKLPKIESMKVLVNSAGVGHFAPHEELSFKEISEIIDLNLKAPLLVTKFYLRELKQNSGYIFSINSVSGLEAAIGGAAYGASKAGLRHFGLSLFKEARKSGLRVVNINPNVTKTDFFDKLHFKYDSDPLCYIVPSDISKVIKDILELRDGIAVTDITIETQIFRLEKKRKVAKN